MNQAKKIAVIGGGSWATANIKMLSDNITEKEIFWWMRNEASIDHIKTYKRNPNYLSSVEIGVPAENINSDIKAVIAGADMILLNIPAAFLKQALGDISPDILKGKKIISAIKGIVPDDNMIIADFMHHVYQIPLEDIVVISGPCHVE